MDSSPASSDWKAERGYYSTYRAVAAPTASERPVRKIAERPGAVEQMFDDELVGASCGVHAGLLARVEPFPTGDLVPYKAGFLSGWVVELYQIDLAGAAQRARESMTRKITAQCAAAVPGDTHRFLQVDPSFSDQNLKHILVPVWLLQDHYGQDSLPVRGYGYTGKMAGEISRSWVKILFASLVALAAAAALFFWAGALKRN